MKRIALISLTVIYLLSALGITVSSFYCCGKLAYTSVSFSEAKKADSKMASASAGCCETKTQVLKVKDQHIASEAFSFHADLFHVIVPTYLVVSCGADTFKAEYTAFYGHAPPDKPKAPIYTLNCTYRI